MNDEESFFKGKKVTVMGIDPEGRGIQDIAFLSDRGASVIATDLKKSDQLGVSIQRLKKYKNIEYVLGEHRLGDFQNRDLIIRAASVPLGSPYIAEAKKQKIEVETDETLFLRLAPKVITIGVTGTRGKSTTTQLIFEILTEQLKNSGRKVFLGGNVRGMAMLPLLHEVSAGDVVIMELSSWHLQGFRENKIALDIAVFTTFFPDHLNYYKGDLGRYLDDKSAIFTFQTEKEYLVLGPQAEPIVRQKYAGNIKSNIIVSDQKIIPADWKIAIPGEHNRYNIALAIQAVKALGLKEGIVIDDAVIKKAVENFKGVPGRLEFLREVKGVKIYNDNNATTPDATIAGIKALDTGKRNIILIFGGTDKNLDMTKLIQHIGTSCTAAVFFRETGTDKIKNELLSLKSVSLIETETFEESVKKGISLARSGDIVLFSPAFASFGRFFKNEFDRGDQFVSIVNSLVR